MDTQVSTFFRYVGEHTKLGSRGEVCPGAHAFFQPEGEDPPPESQTLQCHLCAATAPMTLAPPREGVPVGVGSDLAEVMRNVQDAREALAIKGPLTFVTDDDGTVYAVKDEGPTRNGVHFTILVRDDTGRWGFVLGGFGVRLTHGQIDNDSLLVMPTRPERDAAARRIAQRFLSLGASGT